MKNEPKIITIGLAPAWDITSRGRNVAWGKHLNVDEQTILPAGKALNISKALDWMGHASIAAGLWGVDDFEKMRAASCEIWPLISIEMTVVTGETRKNITIIDTEKCREMHLRTKNKLLSKEALQLLDSDLGKIVKKGSICVFAGAMPEGKYLNNVLKIMKNCNLAGAKIVLDTSGPALKRIVETGLVWLVKPNVAELGELCNRQIRDTAADLVTTGKAHLSKVANLLISRGKNGAIFLNKKSAWQCKAENKKPVSSTVGCGDYLLAGFLKCWIDSGQEEFALSTAVKIAAAKARNMTQVKLQPEVIEKIRGNLKQLSVIFKKIC